MTTITIDIFRHCSITLLPSKLLRLCRFGLTALVIHTSSMHSPQWWLYIGCHSVYSSDPSSLYSVANRFAAKSGSVHLHVTQKWNQEYKNDKQRKKAGQYQYRHNTKPGNSHGWRCRRETLTRSFEVIGCLRGQPCQQHDTSTFLVAYSYCKAWYLSNCNIIITTCYTSLYILSDRKSNIYTHIYIFIKR